MVKRLFIISLSLALAAATMGLAHARPARSSKKHRTIEAQYTTPAVWVPPGQGILYGCSSEAMNGSANIGCVDIQSSTKERFATVEVTDATGLPAAAYVYPHEGSEEVVVCGATEAPFRITPGVNIEIWFQAVSPDCQGVATTGTVTVTLSNHR